MKAAEIRNMTVAELETKLVELNVTGSAVVGQLPGLVELVT